METFNYPKPKKDRKESVPEPDYLDDYPETVYLRVGKNQIKALNVDDRVKMILRGRVKGISSNSHSEGKDRHSLDLELESSSLELESSDEDPASVL